MSIQAMKQALEALEETTALCINYESVEEPDGYRFTEAKTVIQQGNKAITALRAAIEAAERQGQFDTDLDNLCGPSAYARINGKAEKQEPVAWLHSQRSDSDVITDKVKHVWNGVAVGREAQYTIPLYTRPQPAIPAGMVLAKAENLIACRDALVDKDRDEAYHQLYTSVDWGDPFKPWAEWEAMLAAAPKPEK